MTLDLSPIKEFLAAHGPNTVLNARALSFSQDIAKRFEAGEWPLVPAAELNPSDSLKAFSACFKRDFPGIEFVSRQALAASPDLMASMQAGLIPITPALIMAVFDDAFQARLPPGVENDLQVAIIAAMSLDAPPADPSKPAMKDMPEAFADALTLASLLALSTAAVAVVGDAAMFDRLDPALSAFQRCLPIGFSRARGTLVVLTA